MKKYLFAMSCAVFAIGISLGSSSAQAQGAPQSPEGLTPYCSFGQESPSALSQLRSTCDYMVGKGVQSGVVIPTEPCGFEKCEEVDDCINPYLTKEREKPKPEVKVFEMICYIAGRERIIRE